MSANHDTVRKATNAVLEHQHPAVIDAVMRAAVPHWFDGALLSDLCVTPARLNNSPDPGSALPPDLVVVAVQALPFIEDYADDRYRLHALIRQALLDDLLDRDPAFVDRMNDATAANLTARFEDGEVGLDIDGLLELAYHLLAVDAERGRELVETIFADSEVFRSAHLDRLMQYVDELVQTRRLSEELVARSVLWRIWAAATEGDYARVVALGREFPGQAAGDPDLADEIALQQVFALSRRGERDAAVDVARAVASRRSESALGAQAHMMLGELAPAPDDALAEYGRALATFVRSFDGVPRPDEADVLQRERWWLGQVADEPPEDAAPAADDAVAAAEVVAMYDQDDETSVGLPTDSVLGEIWLHIGDAHARMEHLVDAVGWYGLAQELFGAINVADGYQRATGAEQRLVARHGNVERLRELVAAQQETRSWAASTGASQVELQTLLDLGDAYFRLADLDLAATAYAAADEVASRLGNRTQAAWANEGMARVAITQDRFADAEAFLAAARTLADADGNIDLELQLDFMEASRWLNDRQSQRAEAIYGAIVDRARRHDRPNEEANAHLALGRAARNRLDLVRAADHLADAAALGTRIDKLLELDILMEQAAVFRMRHHDDSADALEAEVERRADELSAGSAIGWLLANRAATAARRGDLTSARMSYEQAVRQFERLDNDEGTFNALCGLASVLSEMDQTEEALSTVHRAEAMANEANRPAWRFRVTTELATILANSEQADEAADLQLTLISEQPDNAGLHAQLGWIHLRAGRFDESIRRSEEALELDPADHFPYRNIGHAHLAAGQLSQAREAYAKAIEGRRGDEHFRNTLKELEFIGSRYPGLPGFDEIVALFQQEQARLDAARVRS